VTSVIKKTFIFCIVFLLCGGNISGASVFDEHYDRQVKREHFRNLDNPTVTRMQRNLAAIYQYNLNWSRDVRLRQQPLTDGVVGPVTLFWLQQFIIDFKIEPIGRFVTQVNIRLERIASFAGMFPDETRVLLSADFAHWNDIQPSLQRESYYNIRRNGSDQELLDLVYRYLQVGDQQSDVLRSNALTMHYYQLNAEDFKILQSKELIAQQLAKLENKRYDNVALLADDVVAALQEFPDKIKRLLPFIQQYYAKSDPVITKDFTAALTKKIVGNPLVTTLNSIIAELLEKELSGISYPDRNLYDKAAQAKIRAGIGACYPTQEHSRHVLGLRLSDEDFEQLGKELLSGVYYHGMPNIRVQLAEIKKLRLKKKSDCNNSEIGTIKSFVADLYDNNVQPMIAVLYRKVPEFNPKAPIQWDSDGCGCVLDQLSGTVYGFYPFWLANSGEEQKVNFSVLSRVAYYGLSFDDKGNIQQTNNTNNKVSILAGDGQVNSDMSDFIHVAHKHNSKVDWVIQNDKIYWDNWKNLAFGTRVILFESLADNIARLLTTPLTDGLDQFKQMLTVGMLPPPTQGDGVTLYFNDYPDDPESIVLFNNFFENLKNKLRAADGEYFVNIMLPQSAVGKGAYKYENLLGQISEPDTIDESRLFGSKQASNKLPVKILVLIEEPTTDSKKELRANVEGGGLNGEKRRMLLRNIIPVVTFDGKNWEQLEDDLAYFKDNFGGVGFWPLAIDPKEAADEGNGSAAGNPADESDKAQQPVINKTVSSYLVQYFQNEERSGEPDSWLDEFVCENREMFRIALSLLTLLALFLLWFYFKSCCARGKANKYYLPALLVTVISALVVALLLLLYDPVLEKLSKGNIPLIAVIFICLSTTVIGYQRRKRDARKPTRPRILATHRPA
jgi:hypothetical protein